jgi:hypothetical protein
MRVPLKKNAWRAYDRSTEAERMGGATFAPLKLVAAVFVVDVGM